MQMKFQKFFDYGKNYYNRGKRLLYLWEDIITLAGAITPVGRRYYPIVHSSITSIVRI